MKAILIEDRKERQNLFIEKFNFNLEKYQDVLFNAVDNEYQRIYESIKNDNYKFLENFDVIISHRSAFEDNNSSIIFRVVEFAKKNNKKIVFFSGEIDTIYYDKEDEFEHMELNSTIFYSENLSIFLASLKENKLNILSLAYGEKWKLNIFIEILDKMAKYIQEMKKEKTLFKIFYKKVNLEKLENLGYKIEFDNREIPKPEMIEIKNQLSKYIEDLVKYENYNS